MAGANTILPVSLSVLLSCAMALPVYAQRQGAQTAQATAQARPQAPEPNALPGYYDPALRRFTPLPEVNTAVTAYNLTVTVTPKLVFQSAFQNQFTTIRCYVDVDYLSASFASATNDYGPGDVISLSVNVAFRSNKPKETIVTTVECVGIDVFDEEHDWRATYTDDAMSGTLKKQPVITF